MELWDLHHIRRIDDSGFVRNLYGQSKGTTGHEKDPDYLAEQAAAQANIIAAVKACGHPVGEECGCD